MAKSERERYEVVSAVLLDLVAAGHRGGDLSGFWGEHRICIPRRCCRGGRCMCLHPFLEEVGA